MTVVQIDKQIEEQMGFEIQSNLGIQGIQGYSDLLTVISLTKGILCKLYSNKHKHYSNQDIQIKHYCCPGYFQIKEINIYKGQCPGYLTKRNGYLDYRLRIFQILERIKYLDYCSGQVQIKEKEIQSIVLEFSRLKKQMSRFTLV